MTLSEKIKRYRKENDLSQREFARKAHLSNGYISQLEARTNPKSGRPFIPTLGALNSIALAMNETLDVLLGEIDDMPVSLAEGRSSVDVSEEELALLEAFRAASPEVRDVIFKIIAR